MARLFGHLCSGDIFSHDEYMYKFLSEQQRPQQQMQHASSSTQPSQQSSDQSSQISHALFSQPARGPTEHDRVLKTHTRQLPTGPSSDSYHTGNNTQPSNSTTTSLEKSATPTSEHQSPNMNREPPPTPERTEKARKHRNSIRRTWYKIEELRRQGKWHFHNEPLPTWWPTEEEDLYHAEEPSDEASDVSDPDTPFLATEDQSITDVNNIAPMHTDADADADADLPYSQTSTLSISLSMSISESAFDSQEQPPPAPDSTASTPQTTPNINDTNNNNNRIINDSNGNNKRKRLPDPSIRNRIRAYHAARSGSWSEVSLLSAGNNHTEEEEEL